MLCTHGEFASDTAKLLIAGYRRQRSYDDKLFEIKQAVREKYGDCNRLEDPRVTAGRKDLFFTKVEGINQPMYPYSAALERVHVVVKKCHRRTSTLS